MTLLRTYKTSNSFGLTHGNRSVVSIIRYSRAAWFGWEWYNDGEVRSFNISIAHPRAYKWWSTNLYVYLPNWNTPLDRIPSTGHRSLGDNWAPANPWRGRYRPWRKEKLAPKKETS